jgi:hypothetical protein
MGRNSFSGSYAVAHDKFLAVAQETKARIHTYGRKDLRGKAGEHLACN